jgi:hypothetical protein
MRYWARYVGKLSEQKASSGTTMVALVATSALVLDIDRN